MTAAKRILIVDDDPDALRVTALMLRKAGFEVATAATGDDAMAIVAGREMLDALVTDYAMPGLSGLALLERAFECRPDLPALVMTGYGRDSEMLRLPGRVAVLAKPFTRAEFVRQVESLVGARPAGAAASPPSPDDT